MIHRSKTRKIVSSCAFLSLAFVVSSPCHAADGSTQVVAAVLSHSITAADVNPSAPDMASQQAAGTAEEFEKWFRNHRAGNLAAIISAHVFTAYAEENNLIPSEADLLAYLEMTASAQDEANRIAIQRVRESTDLTAKQKSEILAVMESHTPGSTDAERKFPRAVIENWNVQQALHHAYGGRLLLSSFGTHVAIDATVKFMREQAARGAFQIHDEADRLAFWEHLADTSWGDGVATEEEAIRILDNPPWKMPGATSNANPINLRQEPRADPGRPPQGGGHSVP